MRPFFQKNAATIAVLDRYGGGGVNVFITDNGNPVSAHCTYAKEFK
jgi:hypothetical protein